MVSIADLLEEWMTITDDWLPYFRNSPGQYVKLQATISGLTGLVDGMYDQWEEQAFYLIGDMSTLKESV
jgi:F-type H+-transporting ATPase subunit beta